MGALATALLAAPSLAATYHVDGMVGSSVDFQSQPPYDSYSVDLGVQAGDEAHYDVFGPNSPSFHAQASSLADGGGLHAHTHAQYTVISPNFGFYNYYTLFANSRATLIYTDVVVSGGPVGTTVPTTVNFDLTGSHLVGVSVDLSGRAFTSSTIDIGVTVDGVPVGQGHREVTARYDTNVITTFGQLMLANGVGRIVTPPFNVKVGVPFAVKLELNTRATVDACFSNSFGLNVFANTDFSHTFAFASTGPVFTLPVGYTANSPDAQIVNNSFVPEPSSQLQLACGSAALLLICRPRRRR